MDSFAVSRLNKIRRSDRAAYDRQAVYGVLREGYIAHVGYMQDGRPVVLPMIYGLIGDRLYLHGAKAARFAKGMGPGVPVCITVTLLDALVVARSAFHNSMNYRSVVIHGNAGLVADWGEAEEALVAITDHLLPGRWAESRPMTQKELKSTAVLRVEIEAASMKSRSGPPIDEEEDYALPIWGGLVPMKTGPQPPREDGRGPPEVPIPASVKSLWQRSDLRDADES